MSRWDVLDLGGDPTPGDPDRARGLARRLAADAARLRGEAEDRCVDGIRDALDGSGIKNKSWLAKAWDAVSAPFRSWEAFVDLCTTVAVIAGTVALFISGPIGLALVAVALVAGAAVFAYTLGRYARGEASLGALALDALGLIPGARGVTSLAALGRSAAGMARAVRGGGNVAAVRTAEAALHTGARSSRGMPAFERWERYAPRAYDEIRATDDVGDIARNTGWPGVSNRTGQGSLILQDVPTRRRGTPVRF